MGLILAICTDPVLYTLHNDLIKNLSTHVAEAGKSLIRNLLTNCYVKARNIIIHMFPSLLDRPRATIKIFPKKTKDSQASRSLSRLCLTVVVAKISAYLSYRHPLSQNKSLPTTEKASNLNAKLSAGALGLPVRSNHAPFQHYLDLSLVYGVEG